MYFKSNTNKKGIIEFQDIRVTGMSELLSKCNKLIYDINCPMHIYLTKWFFWDSILFEESWFSDQWRIQHSQGGANPGRR